MGAGALTAGASSGAGAGSTSGAGAGAGAGVGSGTSTAAGACCVSASGLSWATANVARQNKEDTARINLFFMNYSLICSTLNYSFFLRKERKYGYFLHVFLFFAKKVTFFVIFLYNGM